jgi:hypothetical protein
MSNSETSDAERDRLITEQERQFRGPLPSSQPPPLTAS